MRDSGPLWRILGVVVLALLVAAPAAEAVRARKKQQDKKPAAVPVVTIDEGEDPAEAAEEVLRTHGGKRVRIEVNRPPLRGPAPTARPLAAGAYPDGSAYRPVDVPINDPSYDSFPSNFHAEPSITAQGDSVICAFNDSGGDFTSPNPATLRDTDGFAISTDGGATFRDQGKRAPFGSFTSFDGDNVVAAGVDGEIYYLSDGGRDNVPYGTMAASRSTDGGRTFAPPTAPSGGIPHRFPGGFFDKGWIAVDRSQGATRGNVYVTWSDFSFQGEAADLWVARSTDRGATWSGHKLDSFVRPVAVTYVQVAGSGTVYVGEQTEGDVVDGHMVGTNFVRVSTDGGASWSGLRTVGAYRAVGDPQALTLCGDPSFFGGLVRYLNGPIEADSSLRLAVDPTDGTGRTVFVVTHAIPADRPGDGSDVFLWKSTDAGVTWSAPRRVNDDAGTTEQFMPDLWVAPDGTLGVMWLDRRNDPDGDWYLETWMALSKDHGETFTCSFPVSRRPFPPIGICQMSDYNGVYADERRFLLAWGDGRQVDSQRQATFAIYGGTLPLGGPGPILSLDGFSLDAGGGAPITVRLRNDGLASATDLQASISIESNQSLAPSIVVPFPEVPACHGTADLAIPVAFAVTTPYVKAHLVLTGPLGTVSFPFAFSRTTSADLGRRLSVDFESSAGGFTPEPGSLWHVTSTCPAFLPGHSSQRVAYFGLDATCDYNVIVNGSSARVFGGLVSSPVFLPKGAAVLRFKEWTAIPARYRSDHAGLQISTDGGVSFENAWGYGKMSRATLPLDQDLTDGNGAPTWHDAEVDLSHYTGQEVVLRFFFNGIGKAAGGYAVDDVRLFSISAIPGGGSGICGDPQVIAAGSLPAVLTVSTAAATGTVSPAPSCATSPAPSNPFWFELTPSVSGRYTIEAAGEGAFSGTVSVTAGPRCGPAASLGCARIEPGSPGTVLVDAAAGVPLQILVTSLDAAHAGTVTLQARRETGSGDSQVVPIVLDAVSTYGHYRTELTLTNLHDGDAHLTLLYTPSLGARQGGGSVNVTLGAGRQLYVKDAIQYLRDRSLPIPPASTGQQGGTLVVTSDTPAGTLAALARTGSETRPPQPAGFASVAYGASASDAGEKTIFGLSEASGRAKVAVYNTGPDSVTVQITVFPGDGPVAKTAKAAAVRSPVTLPPYGWAQYDDVLTGAGFASGWATVSRVSASGTFGAYGILNDDGTNDGAFLDPAPANGSGKLAVPVLVETGRYTSELVLANHGAVPVKLSLAYRESLSPALGAGGVVPIVVGASRQVVIPSAIDYLRHHGAAIGPAGGSYAGALRVSVTSGDAGLVYAGARTLVPSAAGGAFGVFTPPLPRAGGGPEKVVLAGLLSDSTDRANVAVENTGDPGDGSVTLLLQAYDGATGAPRGSALPVTLAPGEWMQPPGFFAAAGAAQGYVRVIRVSGTASWLAYSVVNDGAAPGQRTRRCVRAHEGPEVR